jgi:uncharacterized membrane protein
MVEPALETGVSKERTISFSDGVFAVAITLLVLKVEIPDLPSESGSQLRHALDETLPALLSYFIGFYVIGKFWLGHHSLFGKLTGIDGRLLNVNLLYLSLIALLPFPTGVLGEHGQIPGAVAIFAGAVALAGLAEGLLLWTALRAGLAGPELVAQRRQHFYETLNVPVIFALSIPIAFVSPDGAKYFWLALFPLRFGGARLGLMPRAS